MKRLIAVSVVGIGVILLGWGAYISQKHDGEKRRQEQKLRETIQELQLKVSQMRTPEEVLASYNEAFKRGREAGRVGLKPRTVVKYKTMPGTLKCDPCNKIKMIDATVDITQATLEEKDGTNYLQAEVTLHLELIGALKTIRRDMIFPVQKKDVTFIGAGR